jgi:site-specific DNA recombinase
MGFTVVKEYTDSAKTGTNADRESFQQMIRDSEKGDFRYLIVNKLDRFSRDKYDSVIYKRKLKINGVLIRSATENLDDSPESVLLESVLEGLANYP